MGKALEEPVEQAFYAFWLTGDRIVAGMHGNQ